jgi:hypothetical protein
MNPERFLVYQPNHGLGIEMAMVHHAARLARILDRTVVLPLLPMLETQRYQGGIEEYFEPPRDLAWISTTDFRDKYGGKVDRLFSLIPQWQEEYRSQLVRDRHPVWLDNILRHPYFALAAARSMFSSDERSIGFSYLHSLVRGNSTYEEPDTDPAWPTDVPPHPRSDFLRAVELVLGGRPTVALHVRRGSQDNARAIHNYELPRSEAFLAEVPDDSDSLVYVATDVPSVLAEIREAIPDARQIHSGHFTRDAVLDLSACILADRFIGTDYSTFTQYVLHGRNQLGRPRMSTVLL